jgi:hypothetical protein
MVQYRHEWKHELSFQDYLILRQRLRAVMEPDPHAPGGFSPGGMPGGAAATESGKTGASWLTLIISAAVLIGGLLAAFLYKRK